MAKAEEQIKDEQDETKDLEDELEEVEEVEEKAKEVEDVEEVEEAKESDAVELNDENWHQIKHDEKRKLIKDLINAPMSKSEIESMNDNGDQVRTLMGSHMHRNYGYIFIFWILIKRKWLYKLLILTDNLKFIICYDIKIYFKTLKLLKAILKIIIKILNRKNSHYFMNSWSLVNSKILRFLCSQLK